MNYLRQLSLIDPQKIGNKSITVIGTGATGSHVALYLAQLGWGNSANNQGVLRVYDFDKVEEHNLPNQAYGFKHIGMQKVDALQDVIYDKCGFKIETHDEKVTDQLRTTTSNYIFLLTDTMSSRKEIYEKCIKYNFNVDLVVETRMGLKNGRIYAFDPNNKKECDAWFGTLYGDDVAEVSLCGASASIISTVVYLSALAVGRVVQHYSAKYGEGKGNAKLWNEVQFSLYPEELMMCRFGEQLQIIQ